MHSNLCSILLGLGQPSSQMGNLCCIFLKREFRCLREIHRQHFLQQKLPTPFLNILFCVSNNYMFQKLTEFPMKFTDIFEMVYGKVCKAPSLLEIVLPLQRNRLVYQRENKLEHFLINDIYLRLPHLPINSNVHEDSWEFGQFL